MEGWMDGWIDRWKDSTVSRQEAAALRSLKSIQGCHNRISQAGEGWGGFNKSPFSHSSGG